MKRDTLTITEVHPRTCILTGAPGEHADDCTTHEHEGEPVTIDITPEGCKTPEGRKRVADAQREWDSVTHELANVLKEFVDLGVTLCEKRGNGFVPDFDAISQIQNLIGARDRKQEAFLRAVAGKPALYPANVNGKQVMVTIPED